MKFFKILFKLTIAFLAICGACYIFIDIVNKLEKNEEDDFEDEFDEDKCLFQKVKEAAQREIARIKK